MPFGTDRPDLEARWLELTRATLPALAPSRAWPVGGCWYAHVAGRPAYRHIASEQLAAAVALGEAVAAGTADLHALNAQPLVWRGKPRPSPRP